MTKEPSKKKTSAFKQYFRDLKSEFKKVVWPSKKQVMKNTGVVLVFMGIVTVGVVALDYVLIWVTNLIF